MSDAAAKLFVERMHGDVEFFYHIAGIEDCDERVAAIRAEGFDCTLDEISAAYGVSFCE